MLKNTIKHARYYCFYLFIYHTAIDYRKYQGSKTLFTCPEKCKKFTLNTALKQSGNEILLCKMIN